MLFELRNIAYKTPTRTILSVDSLNVEAGNHLLLLGQSGCGKTTLMNIMAGLLRATNGDVIFNGHKYADSSDNELDKIRSNNFGFVFQKIHLIGHLSVEQNIALAQPKKDQARINTLIEELALTTQKQQKAHDLSVGEAQRVAIARAVANNPSVIFADEPTSALDDGNTEKVMDLLFQQAEKTNATLIVATHDARIKGRFTEILEMTS